MNNNHFTGVSELSDAEVRSIKRNHGVAASIPVTSNILRTSGLLNEQETLLDVLHSSINNLTEECTPYYTNANCCPETSSTEKQLPISKSPLSDRLEVINNITKQAIKRVQDLTRMISESK